jgi:hypothetical protein
MPVWKYYQGSILMDFADSETTALTSNHLEEVFQQNIREGTKSMADFKGKQLANVSDVADSLTIGNVFPQRGGGPDVRLEISIPIPPMSTVLISRIDIRQAMMMKMMGGAAALQAYFDQFTIRLERVA